MSEFVGAGACFFDYDGDGRIDLFIATVARWRISSCSTMLGGKVRRRDRRRRSRILHCTVLHVRRIRQRWVADIGSDIAQASAPQPKEITLRTLNNQEKGNVSD